MKKNRLQGEFLKQLRKIPIVQISCEKSNISRNSVYRWRKEDEGFRKEMEEALQEGEDFINDMGEATLITMIKEKNWSAVRFWLSSRNPKFKNKLEVTNKNEGEEIELTPEQEEIVREALELSNKKINKYEKGNKKEQG